MKQHYWVMFAVLQLRDSDVAVPAQLATSSLPRLVIRVTSACPSEAAGGLGGDMGTSQTEDK